MTESPTKSPDDMTKIGTKSSDFVINGVDVPPGTTNRLEIRAARLPTGDWLSLPVIAVHGIEPGPSLWLNAALHGDELNGMQIIREVLDHLDPEKLSGRILAVPIVNLFGFILQTRYLPDRRDLNRHFPGSKRGSLASRLAHLFMREIVARCHYGIDLHTGSLHRTNLPQIRADLEDETTRQIAEAFAAPMMFSARKLRGSLRAAATKKGVSILTYEAGEPLRFDAEAIDVGVAGILRVLDALGMRELEDDEKDAPPPSFEAKSTHWLRAARSGVAHLGVRLGQMIEKGDVIGTIADPSGANEKKVRSRRGGLVIGYTNNPLIHQGDALVHLAKPKT
jgi:predicted deacylase